MGDKYNASELQSILWSELLLRHYMTDYDIDKGYVKLMG